MKPRILPGQSCPFCGYSFAAGEGACGGNCPFGAGCQLVRCPRCGGEFSPESRLVTWLRRLLKRRCPAPSPAAPGVVALTQLEAGERSQVVGLISEKSSRRNALAVFGLVPGAEVLVQQKRPAYLVRVGETELALETELAREILVKRIAPGPEPG